MAEGTTNETRPALPVHVVQPQAAHTHTAIMLHGRGSNGPEFADEFFGTHLSDKSSLATKFPGCRWVFPSSKELWSTTFQEHMPAWFEAQSLTDTTLGQDLQVAGIVDSCDRVQELMEEEIKLLHGKKGSLVLGGISQGGAIALFMLLCRGVDSRVGAFFAASTWLPFAANIERVLSIEGHEEAAVPGDGAAPTEYDTFIYKTMLDQETKQLRKPTSSNLMIFLGHGQDDAYVDVELGRQASRVLSRAGFNVEWKEYTGAEEEGHWLQEPDEMDDIYKFMLKFMA